MENGTSLVTAELVENLLKELHIKGKICLRELSSKFYLTQQFMENFIDCLKKMDMIMVDFDDPLTYDYTQEFSSQIETDGIEGIVKKIIQNISGNTEVKVQEPEGLEGWDIPVTGFVIFDGNPQSYEIVLKGSLKIKLDNDNILDCKEFRKQYFCLFGILLPPLKSTEWAELVTEWRNTNPEVNSIFSEEESSETSIKEDVINYIRGCSPIKNIELLDRGFVFMDNSGIYVPNYHIKDILNNSASKMNMTSLSKILQPYLKRSSITKRVGSKVIRFWIFDNTNFGFKEEDMRDLKSEAYDSD